ncbi:MAG TPA: hypothetical protein VFX16_37225 [Pseudonocardiaceae bacterium]|nr:hypothetical protein [Pseudonocardiaceae bacterium]
MDADVLDAVAVVDITPSQATEWFDLVNGAYTASNNDWDTFSRQLNSTAVSTFGTAATTFLEYAGNHGKTELIRKLVAELRDLPSAYASSRERLAKAQPPSSGSSWDQVVRQLGSGWANWDGSEAGWAQFRDWTYTSANTQNADLYAAAYAKLSPLDSLPLADRIATLTRLGFTISAQPTRPDAQPGQPADSLWETVLRDFGPGWANWDGSEAGWAQFRDWTYTSANTQNADLYAAAYAKLSPLDGLPLADRIARVTEFGFTVRAPVAQPAGPAAASTPPAGEVSSPAMDSIIESAVAEALSEVPGAEILTPEDLEQMRAEIAAELASEEDEGTQ